MKGRPFTDAERLRLAQHVDLYARALGVRAASAATGVPKSTISVLRKWLRGGEAPPRLPNPGNTGHGKLSMPIARAIRAKRQRGDSTVLLAGRYGVYPQTIGQICSERLYPEAKAA